MGNFSNPPPILNNGALFDLDYTTSTFNPCNGAGAMLADHLVLQPSGQPSACPSPLDPTTCSTQEGAAALSPFINKTAPNTANAGGGSTSSLAASLAKQGTTSSSGTPTPLSITITATGDPNDPNVPDLASTIIGLQASGPLSFSGNSPVTQTGGTPKPGLTCDANHLKDCAVTLTSVVKLGNNSGTGNPNCDKTLIQPTPSAQCVELTYSAGFRPGDFIVLAVDFNKDSGTIISQNLLTGALYTSIDATGFATTTLFGPVFSNPPTNPPTIVGFTANSGNPDLATANVLLNASTFQNASAVKLGNKLAQCTPPYITVISKNGKQTTTVCPDGNLPDHGE
jgi:hypothetical protein